MTVLPNETDGFVPTPDAEIAPFWAWIVLAIGLLLLITLLLVLYFCCCGQPAGTDVDADHIRAMKDTGVMNRGVEVGGSSGRTMYTARNEDTIAL